jgi:ABC-type transport system substrate-binding protein
VDLEKAYRLLEDAGWVLNKNGEAFKAGEDYVRCKLHDGELIPLELKMMYPQGNHMIQFMQEEGMFTDNLAQVGINLNIDIVDAAVWSSERAAGNVQCLLQGWFPLYADADNNIYTFFHSDYSPAKSCFYNNPEFDALMDAARLSTDDAERQKLYEQADEILSRQDYGSIPLYYPYGVFAAQEYVTNFTVGNLIYHLAYDIDFDMDIYNAQK